MASVIGEVLWYSPKLGYGFAAIRDGENVFVGSSVLAPRQTLRRGQDVEFELRETPKGLKARKVRVLDTMVFRDSAAGRFGYVLFDPNEDWTYQSLAPGRGYTYWGIFETFDAAIDAVDKARESTKVWAIFWNGSAWKGFVQQEDCGSGNWRGSKYGHYGYHSQYPTHEAAEAALRALEVA